MLSNSKGVQQLRQQHIQQRFLRRQKYPLIISLIEALRIFYLNKCYPLVKLHKRSYFLSVILFALKCILLFLTNINTETKEYMDKSQNISINATINFLNFNLADSNVNNLLSIIFGINIFIIVSIIIELILSILQTLRANSNIFFAQASSSKISPTTNSQQNQYNLSTLFSHNNIFYKLLSLLLQVYPYIFYIPSMSMSLKHLNAINYINIILTLLINTFVAFHEYSYEYLKESDWMARRGCWSQSIIFILDTVTIIVFQFQKNSQVLHGWNSFHFFFIVVYEYFTLPLVQRQIQNCSIGFYSICFLVTIQILINKTLQLNVDCFLSLFLIIPLGWKIGYTLSENRYEKLLRNAHQLFKDVYRNKCAEKENEKNANLQEETNIRLTNQPNVFQFDIYVRYLINNVKYFFDDFSNSQFGIILQDIIETHRECCSFSDRVTSTTCFCRSVDDKERSDRNEFLDSKWRFCYLNNYLIDLFCYQIQKLERRSISGGGQIFKRLTKSTDDLNSLKFRFISYLIEVQHNETQAFKELLSLGKQCSSLLDQKENKDDYFFARESPKNKHKSQKNLSLRHQQIVRSLYQRSLASFKFQQQSHLKNKQHEKSMLFSIMSFDEKMQIVQNLLKICIEEKSIIVKNLSQDVIDIEQVFQDGSELRKKRQELRQMLSELINLNSYCSQLEEMCSFFDETISYDGSVLKILRKRKERDGESSESKRKQIFFIMQRFYSPDSAVAFISLMGDPGKIIKISNNFSQVVPNFVSRENTIVGSSINCMIPSQLHAAHDAILMDFGKQEVMQTALRDIPLVVGSDRNGWSVPYQLKIQTFHDLQNQELGICAWIRRPTLTTQLSNMAQESHYISANLDKNGSIINTSEYFFQEVIHKYFHTKDMNKISLFSMMPALEGILKNYNMQEKQKNHSNLVGEVYETLLMQIQPKQQQINWMKQPHRQNLIKELSQLHLYWVQIELNVIKNKYMNILQIEIKSMKKLQNSQSQLNSSADNYNSLYFKIEGLKSLCLQLISLSDWTTDEIAPQFQDTIIQDVSPTARQMSYNKLPQSSRGSSSPENKENKKNFLNYPSISNQIQKFQTISFGGEKYQSQQQEYEIIHVQQVKNQILEDSQEGIILQLTGQNSQSMTAELPFNKITQRENHSFADQLQSERLHPCGEDINLINNSQSNNYGNIANFKQWMESEDKVTGHNLSLTNSHFDLKQINRLYSKNATIENMILSPINSDTSPFQHLKSSNSPNFINSLRNQLIPHRNSVNSFPQPVFQGNNSTTIEKNSSINANTKDEAYPVATKIVKLQQVRQQKQGQLAEYEGSVNSSSKTAHDTLKKEIISKIKSQKKMIVLKGINIIGIIAIFVLYSLNVYNFFSLDKSLNNEKTSFHLIDWCDQVRLSYAYSLSDIYLLQMMQLGIIKFTSTSQALEYKSFILNRLNNSFSNYKQLIEKFSSQDKSKVEIFNTILDTKVNISLYQTQTNYYNKTLSLAYGLTTLVGNMAKYATLNDKNNIHMINANQNYENLINLLQLLQSEASGQYNVMLEDIQTNQIYQMVYVIVVTFFFSLSVLPTYSFIQVKREEILRLLSTISPDKLKFMMNNLLRTRSRINEMLTQSGNNSSPTNKTNQDETGRKRRIQQSTGISNNEDDIIFLTSTQIQKKKNISNITKINKFNFKILIWVLIFFVIMQIYSVSILQFVQTFQKNSSDNRKIMTSLTETKSHISASFAINQVCTLAILVPSLIPPPYNRYFNRAQYLSDLSTTIQNNLYESQKNIHSFTRFEQEQFDSFLAKAIEKNACETLNNFPQYTKNSNFNYTICQTIQKGELQDGLINGVKSIMLQLDQQIDLIHISNQTNFIQQLTIFQKQNNLYIMDRFRDQIDSVIESSLFFMTSISDDLFNYMIACNIILISLQSFAVVIVIFFGWFRYYTEIQEQLQQTKHILDLFEIQILMDNSYIVSYLKKSF